MWFLCFLWPIEQTSVLIYLLHYLNRYNGGPRELGKCLSTIKGVFNENAGMRSNSKKILFVVTTGKSRGVMHPIFPAIWLKKHEVEIFGLTIGCGKDGLQQLKEISSTPVEKHVFWVKELKDVRALSTMLRGKGT